MYIYIYIVTKANTDFLNTCNMQQSIFSNTRTQNYFWLRRRDMEIIPINAIFMESNVFPKIIPKTKLYLLQ